MFTIRDLYSLGILFGLTLSGDAHAIRHEESLAQSTISLSCAQSGECPRGIGTLLVAPSMDSTHVEVCTGVFLRGGFVLTNAHCVPERLRNLTSPQSCQDNIRIFYLEESTNQVRSLGCNRVMFSTTSAARVNEQGRTGVARIPDVAVLEVSNVPSSIPTYEISREGLTLGSTFTLHTSRNHGPSAEYRTLETSQCRVASRTLMLARAMNSYDPVMVLANCSIRPGQSGSGIVDDSGKLRGLAYGYANVSEGLPMPRTADGAAISFSLVVNLACVLPENQPYAPGSFPEQCQKFPASMTDERSSEEDLAFKTLIAESVREAVSHHWNAWLTENQSNPTVRRYVWSYRIFDEIDPEGISELNRFSVIPYPKCIKESEVPRRRALRRGGETVTLQLPRWYYEATASEMGNLGFRNTRSAMIEARLRLFRQESMNWLNFRTSDLIEETLRIPVCAPSSQRR